MNSDSYSIMSPLKSRNGDLVTLKTVNPSLRNSLESLRSANSIKDGTCTPNEAIEIVRTGLKELRPLAGAAKKPN